MRHPAISWRSGLSALDAPMRALTVCAAVWLALIAPQAQARQPSAAAPAPAAPPSAPSVKVYGIVHVAVTGGYGAPESYGRPNYSAVTGASNPVTFAGVDEASTSFQVAQSRFGIRAGEGSPIVGTLELDFIDFNLSSPTVVSKPRLRVASVSWRVSEHDQVIAGQLWDLFAPVQPHHANLVGGHFTAGNLSFMRDQVIWLHSRDTWEVGGALGLPGANGAEALNDLEHGLVPTAALRAAYKPNAKSVVGVGGIATSLRLSQTQRMTVYGAALHTSWQFSPQLEVRGELYAGQNMANIGQLTLAQGHAGGDVREAGGWVSIQQGVAEDHALAVALGMAQILNPEDMLSGYVAATPDAPARRVLSRGLGVERNIHARLSWFTQVSPQLKTFVEPSLLLTRHRLEAVDQGSVSPDQRSVGAQLGMLYTF